MNLYGAAIVAPGRHLAEAAAFKFDLPVVDGAVNGIGRAVRGLGDALRPVQSGFVRNYAVLFGFGLLGAVVWILTRGL